MLIVEGVFEHHVHHEDIMQIRMVDIVCPDAVEGLGRSIVNRGMGKMAGGRAGDGGRKCGRQGTQKGGFTNT